MLTPERLRRCRAASQLLEPRLRRPPEEVVRSLGVVQAQDLRSARLNLRARSADLLAADVDAALTSGSLLVAWLNRGTLHLVCREDYPWLWALTAPTFAAANRRRLDQLGLSSAQLEAALALIDRAVASEGPLSRHQLRARVAEAGIASEGQIMPHLLMLAVIRGKAVWGPIRAGRQSLVLTREWLGGEPQPLSGSAREVALAELARRYLRGHAPATSADLALWSGLPLRDARSGLRLIHADLEEIGEGLLVLRGAPNPIEKIAPRLLPAWDDYLLGWTDRWFHVAAQHRARLHPGMGMARPVATVDGMSVGTWSLRSRRGGWSVRLAPYQEVPVEVEAALEWEAADVSRFMGSQPRSEAEVP